MQNHEINKWTTIINPSKKWFNIQFQDLISYRDLVLLLIYRDFASTYKQTVLGPLWLLIQPILTTGIFTVVFSGFVGISTGPTPPILFYLAGVTCWGYFSDCFTKSASTLIDNAALFGKVYFPRLIIPISIMLSGLLRFGVQFLVLIIAILSYSIVSGNFLLSTNLFYLPAILLFMACSSLGLGLLFSSLSTKYRDLRHLLLFGTQLLMYATPVIYPLKVVSEKWHLILSLNPMTTIVESFKLFTVGQGTVTIEMVLVSILSTLILLVSGVVLFSRVETNFIDSV